MIKKIAILFSLVLISLGAYAQLPVGGWAFHPTFNGVTSITETKGKIFYLSGPSLYSVDKKTGELRSLNVSNDLNGASISNIFTQPDGNYVIVTYADSNMDRINDDGSVINISDIRDATISGKKDINHVGFGKGKFYVSTAFGLVTFDEKKNEARETMFTPDAVACAYGVGDKIVISYNQHILATDASKKLVSVDLFKPVGDDSRSYYISSKGLPIGDNRLLLITNTGAPIALDFDFDNDKVTYYNNNPAIAKVVGLFNMGKDKVVTYDASTAAIYTATDNLASPEKLTFPTAIKSHQITANSGWDHTWAGNAAGIAEFDLTDFSNPTQLCDKFGSTPFSVNHCSRIVTQKSGDIVFWDANSFLLGALGYSDQSDLNLATLSQGEGFKTIWSASDPRIEQPSYVIQDPRDHDTYYVCEFWKYLYRIKNGKKDFTFTPANSGLNQYVFTGIAFMGFDEFDNFWVVQENASGPTNTLHCISYEALAQEVPDKAAWKHYDRPYIWRTTMGTMLNKTGGLAFARGSYSKAITFVYNNHTQTFDDDTIIAVTELIDQDNKSVVFGSITALAEDAKGRLWVGTTNGVFEITDPSKITSETAIVNHLKVPRNDGTGLADYLLDSQVVSGIACDNSNRKWISTTTNGVYLVSENGDQILENFTTDNSILPSNRVWAVACDPNSASVFFATDAGVVEYNSTSAPAKENLNNVYAYPNPVRPDYSGWITVTGLMDNTLVKIADAAGNVFFQGRSEGGMITWDGCNANGDRVKTGVYYVFASNGTSADSGSDGCVTKIMVVN